LVEGTNIALVLLAASALIGTITGFHLKVFALAPIALMIALVSAAFLRLHGFGSGSGIAIIVACLILNQAAYVFVQFFGLRSCASDLSSDDVTDGEPGDGREQAIDGDHGDQKPAPSWPFFPPKK
jgi:hypothetical protein